MSIASIDKFVSDLKAKIGATTDMSEDVKVKLINEVQDFTVALDEILDKSSKAITDEFKTIREALDKAGGELEKSIAETFAASKAAHDEMLGEREAA